MTDATATGALLTTTTSVYFTGQAAGMTLLWLDGFDGYSTFADITNEYIFQSGFSTNAQINTTAGRFGGNCVQVGNSSGGLRRQLGMFFTQAWMGFAHRRDRVGGGDDKVAQWYSGSTGTIELTLTLNNDTGILKVWRGDRATVIATATIRIPNSQTRYHWYEWFVNFDGSAGATEVWVDGAPVIQATGLNTKQTTATALSAFGIGTPGVDAVWMNYDDVYVSIGGRVGDMRVVTRMPTSDATPNDGTPSTGTTHWSLVDENPTNTTDYVTLVNVNLTSEMYGLSSFPAAAIKVHGVRVSATGRKNQSINGYNISVVAKSGSSESVSDPVGLSSGTTWAGISKMFPTDPATGAGWTVSAATAMIAGVRVMV